MNRGLSSDTAPATTGRCSGSKASFNEKVTIERIDTKTESEAWAWLRRHDERPYSFVDATSFALMRKLRIEEALAFDGDFAAAGFVELRP